MNKTDKLIRDLIDESIAQEKATLAADSKKMSQHSIKIYEINEELRSAGSEECRKIIPLLNDLNNYVKFNCAYTLIPLFPEEARQALTEVAKEKGLIAFRSGKILEMWNDGKLKY